MRFKVRLVSILILLCMAAPIPLLKGCATIDKEEDCPAIHIFYTSCANYANDGDTITGPEDSDLEMPPGFSGGTVDYVPLQYVVRDSNGAPRNNVCVDFYTDGYFYADINYITNPPSWGIGKKMTLRTNDRGVICVYWGTEDLPSSSAEDTSGTTYVEARSGTVTHLYNVTWTVKALP